MSRLATHQGVQIPRYGIIERYIMRSSRSVAILAVALMLGFMLPMLCLAVVATDVTAAGGETMPGGCHGQHSPMQMPSHSCCYASHQVPQAVPIALALVPQCDVLELIDAAATSGLRMYVALAPEPLDSSPPSSAVLRI